MSTGKEEECTGAEGWEDTDVQVRKQVGTSPLYDFNNPVVSSHNRFDCALISDQILFQQLQHFDRQVSKEED